MSRADRIRSLRRCVQVRLLGRYSCVMADADAPEDLARAKLADSLPRRWRHVGSVARRARWVAHRLSLSDNLVAAAWLHDIGYAPDLVDTGFHPLDGARYLRQAGVDEGVISLVAYHSCAPIEAKVRGLDVELASEFSPGDPALADALLYCDMTTGPDGDYVRPAERLVEIRGRYGPDHEVTRFVELAAPEILATAARVEDLLGVQPR
jgi:HD domain